MKKLLSALFASFIIAAAVTVSAAGEYPESFDLRAADFDGDGKTESYITPVKQQTPFGSCWAFSTTAAAEGSILAETKTPYDKWSLNGNKMDLSEHHLSWFFYAPLGGDNDRFNNQGDEGMHIDNLVEESPNMMYYGGPIYGVSQMYAAGMGPAMEADFPYYGKGKKIAYSDGEPYSYSADDDWTLDEADRFTQIAPLEESFKLPEVAQYTYNEETGYMDYSYNPDGTDAIKEQLMAGRPVAVGYYADVSRPGQVTEEEYLNPDTWAQYVPVTYREEKGAVMFNHGVLIVGWDDNFSRDNFTAKNELPPGDGAWIVKNSWGAKDGEFPDRSDWGIDGSGYFYLSYYDHSLTAMTSFDFDVSKIGRENKEKVQMYDYLPSNSYVEHMDTLDYDGEAAMANVFTAKEDMILKAVSVYTDSLDISSRIDVYLLNDNYKNPRDGSLIASETNTYPYAGYHRVNLGQTRFIPKGAKYSVVAESKRPDGTYEILTNRFETATGLKAHYIMGIVMNMPEAQRVINPGESLIENGGKWTDLGGVVTEKETENLKYLNDTFNITENADAALKAYDTYYDFAIAHLDKDGNITEQDKADELYNAYTGKRAPVVDALNRITIEDIDDFGLYLHDNFPVHAITEPVEAADHLLYFDGKTGRLYSTFDTSEETFSDPIDVPGAKCDGNTLTLTSEFQFATTREDGLYLSEGATLYVPEGESPSIHSAVYGTVENDKVAGNSGLFAYPGCTIDIDGSLAVTSGDMVNGDNWAVVSSGDLTITGGGSLYVSTGSASRGESGETDRWMDSIGIYTMGNLNISIANVDVHSGAAYGASCGIVASDSWELGIIPALTITGGSDVRVESGASQAAVSIACLASVISVDGKSSVTARASGGNASMGMYISCDADGTDGSLKLSDGSSVTVEGGDASASVGIVADEDYGKPTVKTEIGRDCALNASGRTAAVRDVTFPDSIVVSDGVAAAYDGEKGTFVDMNGYEAKSISLYPYESYNIAYENGAAAITAPAGQYMAVFAAYDGNGKLISAQSKSITVDASGSASVSPDGLGADAVKVNVMLWKDMDGMTLLCRAHM